MSEPAKLITEEYRRLQAKLHESPEYGIASVNSVPLVAQVINAVGATELLDYGAGKGRLDEALCQHLQRPIKIFHYDPARPEWATTPAPAQFVACLDVLEHIEPNLLDNVLDDLRRVTAGTGIFTVATGPVRKTLPDGRNAHLIPAGLMVAAEIHGTVRTRTVQPDAQWILDCGQEPIGAGGANCGAMSPPI